MRRKYVRQAVYESLPARRRRRLFDRTREVDRGILAQMKWEAEEIKQTLPKVWEHGITIDIPDGGPVRRLHGDEFYFRRKTDSELNDVVICVWPNATKFDGRNDLKAGVLDAIRRQSAELLRLAAYLERQFKGVIR